MNRLQRAAAIVELVDQLQKAGSWCGETHVQKSIYIARQVAKVELDYEFVLYKHGPFSFDLRDEITGLRADGMFALKLRPPYGPTLAATPAGRQLRVRFESFVRPLRDRIAFVVNAVGSKGVADLERLATAVFVTTEALKLQKTDTRAIRLNELKPHIAISQAKAAMEEVDALLLEAPN